MLGPPEVSGRPQLSVADTRLADMTTSPDPSLLEAGGLRFLVDGPVATVTLDRPRSRNSQTPATWRALAHVGSVLPRGVRVVLVRGAGEVFSSGLDRSLLEPASGLRSLLGGADPEDPDGPDSPGDAAMAAVIAAYQEGFTWLRRPDIVSVAVVQGAAVGAGFQLALACDLRVLTEDARFSMREPQLGLVPDLTGTKPLVDCVGYSRAVEICVTSRWVPADEARETGLATRVVSAAELDVTVSELVAALVAAPHGAVTETKALLQSATRLDLDAQRRAEREAQVRRLRDLAAPPQTEDHERK
jgi:enoyl-CoA hydratase/carnithine racemase